jgi:ABC-type multidrug transport system fused ATPase/permease subunit
MLNPLFQSTANLDHDTDVAVQQTIREELGSSTILCIARESAALCVQGCLAEAASFIADRLHTIIDFDRVLVLGQGEVLEYDTPSALLAKEDSEFYRLCSETGDLQRLKELADGHAAEVSGS